MVVIGKKAKHVAERDAMSRVFGYTIGNDVSERQWQHGPDKDLQWWRAKGSDTFTPLGPVIAIAIVVMQVGISVRLLFEQTDAIF